MLDKGHRERTATRATMGPAMSTESAGEHPVYEHPVYGILQDHVEATIEEGGHERC